MITLEWAGKGNDSDLHAGSQTLPLDAKDDASALSF